MWKKMLPLVVLSTVLLVGCNNNDTMPKKNETPMEDVRDDARQWKNDVERDFEGRNYDNGTQDQNELNNELNPGDNQRNEVDLNDNHMPKKVK